MSVYLLPYYLRLFKEFWCFTVEPGFQGHCGGPKLDWGWCFTVEPGFQGHCGGPKLDRACYFGCFVEKSKAVFYVCVYNKINKTHILYRCFAQIQLWNSEIQRVDCRRFVTFVHVAHLWEWGQCRLLI